MEDTVSRAHVWNHPAEALTNEWNPEQTDNGKTKVTVIYH